MSLYRKYRPKDFQSVAGQSHVTTSIKRQLETGRLAHAFLFSGPRGVGKTTIARLIAKASNCQKLKGAEPCQTCKACKTIEEGKALDIIEIDAASNTGVDNVRENIIESTRVRPVQLTKKVFIIDEVHMLSKGAFNALLKTLEEPPEYVIFILATTELHKIPDTIISRCQRFDFGRIEIEEITERLAYLAKQEGKGVDKEVLINIAQRSEGCLRDAESLLGQVITIEADQITQEEASTILPQSNLQTVFTLLQAIAKNNLKKALKIISTLQEKGIDTKAFTDSLTSLLRKMLLNTLGSTELSGEYSKEQTQTIETITEELTQVRIKETLERTMKARKDIGSYNIETLPLELAVIDLCQNKLSTEPKQLQKKTELQPLTEPQLESNPEQQHELKPEQEQEQEQEQPQEDQTTEEQIKKKWGAFKKAVKEKHTSLPLALELAEPTTLKNNILTIIVQFAFYAETINQEKNNRLLVETLEKIIGKTIGIKAVSEVKTEQEEGNIAQVLNDFGGEVIN